MVIARNQYTKLLVTDYCYEFCRKHISALNLSFMDIIAFEISDVNRILKKVPRERIAMDIQMKTMG